MHKPMHDGGPGVMHPATALMSMSLVGGMVSVIGDNQCSCWRLSLPCSDLCAAVGYCGA